MTFGSFMWWATWLGIVIVLTLAAQPLRRRLEARWPGWRSFVLYVLGLGTALGVALTVWKLVQP